MKICVFGDIHGNYSQLEKLTKTEDFLNADLKICLGDVVGLGPYQKECMDLLSKYNCVFLMGNHEARMTKLIDDLDKHYEPMEKAWLKNLDKLSDEEILDIVDDCMGKSKTLVGKSEMLKNKMIDDLSKAYDDYIDDIDRQIRIGKSEDEVKEMIETTLENDIKMYLKLAYNNKASSNYFMVKFAEDNLI